MEITKIEKIKDSAKIAGVFAVVAWFGSLIASIAIKSGMDDIINPVSFGFQTGHDVIIDIIKVDIIYPVAAGAIVFAAMFILCLWALFTERKEESA